MRNLAKDAITLLRSKFGDIAVQPGKTLGFVGGNVRVWMVDCGSKPDNPVWPFGANTQRYIIVCLYSA